jgi:drug/metabolite transporter (DMT)-like permease
LEPETIAVSGYAAIGIMFAGVFGVSTMDLQPPDANKWMSTIFTSIYAVCGAVCVWYGYWSDRRVRFMDAVTAMFIMATPLFVTLVASITRADSADKMIILLLLTMGGISLTQPLLNRIRARPQ